MFSILACWFSGTGQPLVLSPMDPTQRQVTVVQCGGRNVTFFAQSVYSTRVHHSPSSTLPVQYCIVQLAVGGAQSPRRRSGRPAARAPTSPTSSSAWEELVAPHSSRRATARGTARGMNWSRRCSAALGRFSTTLQPRSGGVEAALRRCSHGR